MTQENAAPLFEELHPSRPMPLDAGRASAHAATAASTPLAARTPGGLPRQMWAVGGVLLLGLVGLGAALAMRSGGEGVDPNAEMSASAPAAGATAGTTATASSTVRPSAHRAAPSSSKAKAPAAAPNSEAAAPCTTCGVIESVAAEKRQGEGSGVGAVAGGVLGGLVGNQMGKGSGKTAMTVLGAVGGGFAGNAVEKHMKATTVYRVSVRMADGSERHFVDKAAPAVGTPVIVEGDHYRVDTEGAQTR